MKLAGEICTARTKVQLIKAFKNTLPNFFGFEDVGVLIRDMKTDILFTLNEIKNEEHDDWMRLHALHYDKKKCLKEPMRDVEKIIVP